MSTSLLYNAFGLRGYQYCRTEFFEGRVCFTVEQPRERYRCPDCGSAAVHGQGHKERFLQTVPIGLKPTYLLVKVPRVICFRCERTRQVKVPFADPRRTYTHTFERYALELSKLTTIQDVARHLGVSWDIIKDIQKRHLQRRFGKPKLKNLKEIAIDEVAVGKGHRYFTLVLDLQSGAVVYVGEGKGVQALTAFWRRLRAARAKVRAVATDMGRPYIRAVREQLPRAVHVFDHFHVVKLFNDKLSALRRELHRQLPDAEQRRVLKGTRWLLLKNPENLDSRRNEQQRLRQALRLNTPLSLAYYLKEDLRQIWGQPNKATARLVLNDWIRRAKASGIPILGTNNKIQTMKRQAYGFRDHEFFKLKILGLHQTKYALVLGHSCKLG